MTVMEKEPETVVTKPKSTRKKSTKKAGTASAGAGSVARKPATRKKTAVRKATSRKVTTARNTRNSPGAAKGSSMTATAEERQRMIAEAAYYLAERRGFAGGDPRQDWLDAEASIDATLIDTKIRKG